MKKFFLSLIVVTVLASSCKKDDTLADITPTVQNLSGSYTLSKVTSKTGSSAEEPLPNWYEACEKDDVYKLHSNLTYEVVDAGTQCEPNSGYTGEWSLINSTTIVIDDETGTIKKFDGKNLHVAIDYFGTVLTSYYVKQ